MIHLMEAALKRGVIIKVITRINVASIGNLSRIEVLMKKYPGSVEIRHAYQPLRGFVFDDKIARFKNEEVPETYKKGELNGSLRLFYEVYDREWVLWLQNIFWKMFRSSIDYETRLREIKSLLGK